MSRRIRLPNDDMVSNRGIESVSATKTGVIGKDAQRNISFWIPVDDPVKRAKVVDIMSDFADAGDLAVQPDWSFLKEPTPES